MNIATALCKIAGGSSKKRRSSRGGIFSPQHEEDAPKKKGESSSSSSSSKASEEYDTACDSTGKSSTCTCATGCNGCTDCLLNPGDFMCDANDAQIRTVQEQRKRSMDLLRDMERLSKRMNERYMGKDLLSLNWEQAGSIE